MAQVTQLSAYGVPGRVQSFQAKTEAVVAAAVALTLRARSVALTLQPRSVALTLQSRSVALTLQTRSNG